MASFLPLLGLHCCLRISSECLSLNEIKYSFPRHPDTGFAGKTLFVLLRKWWWMTDESAAAFAKPLTRVSFRAVSESKEET
ncbi:uncharacterized protein BYT42DRAFT_557489 [Radiomyces spectabilis]|uniref:uncharacterized protein n=1 Tax=Radiomyces spectabilis TaxID=64574 RepID=UPI00221FD6DF|nr:uncharacterized protein BYT42DRAFT_557489 [Radiomyces spectabilis]KAI8391615.1 hypothetical protein BYT42DRAFT_557489 [Radiomyces spectabilis]